MTATITPGSDVWRRHITASKAAAIIGQSPYTSAYQLWHEMAGLLDPEPESGVMSRGHWLEPAVLAWWFDRHPEWENLGTETQYSDDLPGFAVNPDAVARHRETGQVIPVEAKTSALYYEWGPGPEDVPRYYAAQALLTMHVMDATWCAVPVLTAGLDFREYRVDYDPQVAGWIVDQCAAFLASLDGGQPPPLDGSLHTYDTWRRLHPDIEDRDVELSPAAAERLAAARAGEDIAEQATRAANLAVLQEMGTARRALVDGRVVAYRKASRPGAAPFLARPPRQK